MATENKGVMVYLPKEVEEYITEFCTEYNITRKDKEGNVLPSLGTGVVTYLKSKISGESPDDILTKPSKLLSNGLSKEEVLDLVNEYLTSNLPSSGLSKDEVLDLIERSVTNSHSPQSIGASDVENIVSGYVEKALAPIREELAAVGGLARNSSQKVAKRESTGEKPSARTTPQSKPDGALTRGEIVEKLGKPRQSIESRRNNGTLAEWGYRAEKSGNNWYYFPIDQPEQIEQPE